MSVRDSNVCLSLGKVDYLILFEFGECAINLWCNLANVPQVKFRKIRLFKFPQSAFRKVHHPNKNLGNHVNMLIIISLFLLSFKEK